MAPYHAVSYVIIILNQGIIVNCEIKLTILKLISNSFAIPCQNRIVAVHRSEATIPLKGMQRSLIYRRNEAMR